MAYPWPPVEETRRQLQRDQFTLISNSCRSSTAMYKGTTKHTQAKQLKKRNFAKRFSTFFLYVVWKRMTTICNTKVVATSTTLNIKEDNEPHALQISCTCLTATQGTTTEENEQIKGFVREHNNWITNLEGQGWYSGDSVRLPPMWPFTNSFAFTGSFGNKMIDGQEGDPRET